MNDNPDGWIAANGQESVDFMNRSFAIVEAARNYVGARMRMSEAKEDTLTLICNVDLAWAELVDLIDLER